MASACYNRWRVYQNSKGQRKWVNEGAAPDGGCPSCPSPSYPAEGTWDGYSAKCNNGRIVKMVADGTGGLKIGDVIANVGSAKAISACFGNSYIGGSFPISNYF